MNEKQNMFHQFFKVPPKVLLTHFTAPFLYIPPENIRKPEIFWCFQGVQKETPGMKWVKALTIIKSLFMILSNTNHIFLRYITVSYSATISTEIKGNIGQRLDDSYSINQFLTNIPWISMLSSNYCFIQECIEIRGRGIGKK